MLTVSKWQPAPLIHIWVKSWRPVRAGRAGVRIKTAAD